MIRFLVLISLVFHFTYAGSEKYFIKFGSFKDLRGLEKNINRLPRELRSHVVIVHSNSWYIPFAYYTSDKNALNSKVSAYKRYFRDAHIAHSAYMLSYPLVRNYATKKRTAVILKRQYIAPVKQYQKINYQYTRPLVQKTVPVYQNVGISEEDHILQNIQPHVSSAVQTTVPVVTKILTQKVVFTKVEENDVFVNARPKKYKNFSKQMLSGQHYYLAYKKTEGNSDLLIKVTFGNHQVTYQPIIGDMQMTQASYVTEGDRLYMFTDTFTRNGSFSKLDEHRDNHFLVSSWVNGKKLNTLRYYYKMNDAKEYLDISTSTGLSEILSEGDYDDFFLDE